MLFALLERLLLALLERLLLLGRKECVENLLTTPRLLLSRLGLLFALLLRFLRVVSHNVDGFREQITVLLVQFVYPSRIRHTLTNGIVSRQARSVYDRPVLLF